MCQCMQSHQDMLLIAHFKKSFVVKLGPRSVTFSLGYTSVCFVVNFIVTDLKICGFHLQKKLRLLMR